jgi:hypothetical protein
MWCRRRFEHWRENFKDFVRRRPSGWTSFQDRLKVKVVNFVNQLSTLAIMKSRLGRIVIHLIPMVGLAALMTLTGCGTAKIYDGPARSKDQVAVLFRHANDVEILSVDGQRLSLLKRVKVLELLPGSHTIECCFRSEYMGTGYASASSTKGTVRLSFEARPGYTYWVESNVNPFKEEWQPQVMSRPSKNEEPSR